MIVRALTSLPLVALGLLWLYLAIYFGSDVDFMTRRGWATGFLLMVAVPLIAGSATLYAIWRFRQLTGERAAGRIMLAAVESVFMLMWLGSALGWGGGV